MPARPAFTESDEMNGNGPLEAVWEQPAVGLEI